jgi:hypothetical protein
MYASDASVGALPDEAEDAHRRDHHQVSWDEGAGKLAVRVLDAQASDACPWDAEAHRPQQWEQEALAALEPDTPDAAQSAAQSYVAAELWARSALQSVQQSASEQQE